MSVEQKKAVRAMQKYIKSNLKQSITLKDLSNTSGYSMYHAAKVFKSHTHINAFDYIRKLRLTAAAKRLRDTHDKVIDVALDFVFDSHEGFTRAFSSAFKITPKSYQIHKKPIHYFMPYDIPIGSYVKKKEKAMNETKSVFVQIMERPKRKLILKRGIKATEYFEYCNEVGCDVWGILSSVHQAISEPMGMWLSKPLIKSGTSTYVQGVEVAFDYDFGIPEGFEIIDLEATKILVFQGEPYDDQIFKEAIAEMSAHIKKYNPETIKYQKDAQGYHFQYEPQGYRGYIEGYTIKEIK